MSIVKQEEVRSIMVLACLDLMSKTHEVSEKVAAHKDPYTADEVIDDALAEWASNLSGVSLKQLGAEIKKELGYYV